MIRITWTQLDEDDKRISCEILAEGLGHLGCILDSAGLDSSSEDYYRKIRDIKIEVSDE